MIRISYGYYVNLEKHDREELEHLINFKSNVDFEFHIKNWQYLEKELDGLGWTKCEENIYENETELIYEKENKKIYFYK